MRGSALRVLLRILPHLPGLRERLHKLHGTWLGELLLEKYTRFSVIWGVCECPHQIRKFSTKASETVLSARGGATLGITQVVNGSFCQSLGRKRRNTHIYVLYGSVWPP